MKKIYIDPEIEIVKVQSADVITVSSEDVALGAFTVSGTGMGFDGADSWVW